MDGLRRVRGFVLDLDGTLVLEDSRDRRLRPLPGALALIEWLAARGLPYRIFTNGTARAPAEYVRLLREAGFPLAGDDTVMTPADSAADLFRRRDHRRVLALAGGLAPPLHEAGIDVVPPSGNPDVDAVLIGQYRGFTMDALEAACQAVWAGAAVYSCSQGTFYATADGRALGTSRAISGMIKAATGCRVELVGKPSRHALHAAARRVGVRPSELAVVGDDPELEVPMAHRGRAYAVAVGTGLGAVDAYDHLPEQRRPHLIVGGVDELLAQCREAFDGPGAAGFGRP